MSCEETRFGGFSSLWALLDRSTHAIGGEVAVLPFEVQQWLRSRRVLQAQRFDFANDDQVVTCGVFGVDFAIEPVQAAGDDGVAQWRLLPVDAVPFVGASAGELVGDFDLFTGEDVDDEAAGLADFGVAGRGGHDAE